jgi:uncharacterized SAM-binding protein YcdF (DUF218 family)
LRMSAAENRINIHLSVSAMIRRLALLPGLAACSTLLYFVLNLLLIFPWSPSALVTADELKPCDLIVILGGGRFERIDYAFSLAARGYGKTLFLPNPGNAKTGEYLREKLRNAAGSLRFFAGRGAVSTYEEALATRNFAAAHSIRSILLVTSPYHSLRAAWIFRKVMPRVAVISAPCCLGGVTLGKKLEYYYPGEREKFLFYYLLFAWRDFGAF